MHNLQSKGINCRKSLEILNNFQNFRNFPKQFPQISSNFQKKISKISQNFKNVQNLKKKKKP